MQAESNAHKRKQAGRQTMNGGKHVLTHLCEINQQLQHVWQALASDGAGGDHVHILALVWVLPVQCHIQALLIQVQHRLLQPLIKLTLDMLLLAVQALLNGGVCLSFPVKEPVNLQSSGMSYSQ